MPDNLTTFMCGLCCKLEASTSWNTQGLSRPVMRFLYLYLYLTVAVTVGSESSGEDSKLRHAVLFLEWLPMPRRSVVT